MSFRNSSGFVRIFVTWFIRILLLLGVIISYIYGRDLIFLISILGFLFTFIPFLLRSVFGIGIPAEFEMIVLFFLYGVFIFIERRGLYAGLEWLSVLLTLGEGIILSFVALSLFYALEEEGVISASSFMVLFFTFTFTLSFSTLWELFEFFLDTFFGFGLQVSSSYLMLNLFIHAVVALFIGELGYYNHLKGRPRLFSSFFYSLVRRNSSLFRSESRESYNESLIRNLLSRGEGPHIEFKSTLRKNLHTNNVDRKIEHAVLKTITGFLNSKGGTLLVGISDSGDLIGLENDDFTSHDRLRIFLTGLFRSHLGNQYLPFISSDICTIDSKDVLKITCRPSSKRVFLKWEGHEEFYVRHGASTVQLEGSDLLDYVSDRF